MKNYKLSEIKAICEKANSNCCECELYDHSTSGICQVLGHIEYCGDKPDGWYIDPMTEENEIVLRVGKDNQALDKKTIEYFVKHNEEVRKQTAKEVFQELYDRILTLCKESFEKAVSSKDKEFGGANRAFNQIRIEVKNVAKKYGVEVER